MKKLLILLLPLLFTTCGNDEEVNKNEKKYNTVVGNTYTTETVLSSDKKIYGIYEFKSDGSIVITENINSINGELYNKSIGHFEYSHPTLKLEIQSIKGCNNCFNYFTAEVSDDRRTFNYKIFYTDENYSLVKFNITD